MEVFPLIENLRLCYERMAPTVEDYVKLSNDRRLSMCVNERRAVLNFINSDNFTFLNITSQLKRRVGKFLFLIDI